jgi:hypothetical protein
MGWLQNLDRRWIYLAMLLAVAIPQLLQVRFPEQPTPLVQAVFDKVEQLPEGSRVLLSLDYGPVSAGDLEPMTAALARHCCLKRHKVVFMTLWPDGKPAVESTITKIINVEFPEHQYGRDHVDLGYKAGKEVVIKTIATNLRLEFEQDNRGTPLDELPLTSGINNLEDFELLVSISAGFPGLKEWVQYASSPLGVPLAVGATAVQAPQAYPYIPGQMLGILAAIKGAAEYEVLLGNRYPAYATPTRQDAVRRMAPQFSAHLLIIALIVLGNLSALWQRWKGPNP